MNSIRVSNGVVVFLCLVIQRHDFQERTRIPMLAGMKRTKIVIPNVDARNFIVRGIVEEEGIEDEDVLSRTKRYRWIWLCRSRPWGTGNFLGVLSNLSL